MSKLSSKQIKEATTEKLFDLYDNNLAYLTRTGSKIRQENRNKIKEEIINRTK